MIMPERRENQRFPIRLIMNTYQDGVPTICVAEDISTTGIRVRRLLHTPGTSNPRVRFELQLPGQARVITGSGEVVRSAEGQRCVGVHFTRISDADRARIERYVNAKTVSAAA